MQFKNFLTTPSGKRCYVKEVTQEQFLVLIKYTNASDFTGFFNALDGLIKETVPDFDEYNVIDKAYVYLAFCFYSIRQSIPIKERAVGGIYIDSEISLATILENIENSYTQKNERFVIKANGKELSFTVGLPRRLIFSEEGIAVDYATGLEKINDKEFSREDINKFLASVNGSVVMEIWKRVEANSKLVCNLVDGTNKAKIEANLLSPEIFYVVFMIFNHSLDVFYEEMYVAVQYMRLTMSDFLKMTRLEFVIFTKNFNKDKEEQRKDKKTLVNPAMEDMLMGQ